MKKKIVSLLIAVMVLIISIPRYSFAETSGKVIFISMNRTNLVNMLHIPSIKEEVDNRGYVGLMNVRGDKGTDDRRSYASMGAGGRVNVSSEQYINFQEANKDTDTIFKAATGKEPKEINDLTINKSLNENLEKGQYGSVLGSLGQTLSDNKLKTAVLGNSDVLDNEGNVLTSRNLCLVAMDNYGRIDAGNIDDINVKDSSMPYGIRTDYKKLIDETKKYYEESDALFIELGDTTRLDDYKQFLNEDTYENMRHKINKNIDSYLKEVFNMVGENDVVYISSAFPSNIDYSNRRRLSPIIKFKGNEKGLLLSATTRREGIVANVDVGVDILSEFGLENPEMVGRKYTLVNKEDNVKYVSDEYEKIVSVSNIRSDVVNTFVGVVSVSWVLAMLLLLFRDKLPHKEITFKVLKEFIKLGLILPISFLIAPIFNFKTPVSISVGIIGVTLGLYILGRILFKDDLKHMGFFATATIALIAIDAIFGTTLMKSSIMSYDAIIGARYYGMGNEYQGIAIGSAIFGLAVLLDYKKIPKWFVALACFVILITSASPVMGANVGAAISESVAYLLLILLIFDVKLDFKKVILLGCAAVLVVVAFAAIDIISGSQSHLSGFVNQIIVNGPSAIIQTFSRKIQMNLKLAQTSVWVNILLVGVAILGIFIFRPSKHFKKLSDKYPFIFKGFIACMIGCLVTLLVNDSGIVAAATASIYILIPLLIISINMIIFDNKNN